MNFTYDSYKKLLSSLKEHGYNFCNYQNYEDYHRCVILRHDIDQSLDKAVKLAEIESDAAVSSTWFALLKTDFYNPASKSTLEKIKHIHELGHEIGLHFDEMAYDNADVSTQDRILREAETLSQVCSLPIKTVSMHRPSKATLAADLKIPGIVNSYSQMFFHEFKYLSDSRKRWREPVEEIIESGEYNRLHLLTHAIWYDEAEIDMAASIRSFIEKARSERYESMKENISDLESVLRRENL